MYLKFDYEQWTCIKISERFTHHGLRSTGAAPLCRCTSITWMKTANKTCLFKTTSWKCLVDVIHLPSSWNMPKSSNWRQHTRLSRSESSQWPHLHHVWSTTSLRSIKTRPSAYASPLLVCEVKRASVVF